MIPYLIYIALQSMLLLSFINTNAISVAFPDITSTFNASLVLAGWVLSIYLLVATAATVLVGKVGEIFGRKRLSLVCVGMFVLGSFLAAISPNIYWLIFSRFIQSIGGGGITPMIVGIVTQLFPHNRQRALGLSMGIANTGGIIGPSVGAWLISIWGWRSIFWFNIPFGILIGVSIMVLLKMDKGHPSRIDFKGAGIFVGSLFSIMIGLSQISRDGSTASWLLVGLLFLAGIVFIALFIRHEIKSKDPIIALDLLRRRQFASAHVYNFFVGAFMFAFSSFIPLFVISIYHLTTVQSGLILSFRFIGTIVAALSSSFLLVRWGYHRPLLIGSLLIAFSIIFMGIESPQLGILNTDLRVIVVLSALGVLSGVGLGIISPAVLNACVDLMPQRAPTITGLVGMFNLCGGAINIAVTTLILQYTGNMTLGFEISFVALGCMILGTTPFIFALPGRTASFQTTEKAEA